MDEIHLEITTSQRDLLLGILNESLRQKLVEIRRSRYSFEFRSQLESDEHEIESLLGKLGHTAATA